jgi:hypothetical protein
MISPTGGSTRGLSRASFSTPCRSGLASPGRGMLGKAGVPQEAPLAGLIFDDRRTAMTPTYGMKRGS